MFDFFRSRTRDEYIKEGKAMFGLPEPKESPTMPKTTTRSTNKELYRVGYNGVDQLTTLTLMGDNGISMTLSLSQAGCEQLIRMLQSTYLNPVKETENADA